MLITKFPFVLLIVGGYQLIQAREDAFIINGNKIINVVSKEFISFSVDLNSLFNNINNSSNAFVKNLTPAFLRVVDLNNELLSSNNQSLAKWRALQEWFKKYELVPIFTINNKQFNPNDLEPFLEINEEVGHTCYWQLAYDCDYKSLNEYKEDLMKLKYVLDTSSPSKILSSNLRSCRNTDANILPNVANALDGIVDAYMWDFLYTKRDFIPKQTPTWIAMPKTKRVGFQSALQWAKQIGEAAKNAYKVIFWQSDFNDIFSDTPVFWTSFLYKKIIGKNIFDMKISTFSKPGIDSTAFCSNVSKKGAMVITIVNNAQQSFIVPIKLASIHPENINIQKYILTSGSTGFTYLNGEQLTSDVLENGFIEPDVDTVQVDKVLHLNIPSQAIGIFVLLDAKIPACSFKSSTHQEEKLEEIMSRLSLNGNSKKLNFAEVKNTLDDLNNAQSKEEIVGSVATANNFNRFLENKVKTFKKNHKPARFTEKSISSNRARQIDLQLTNDEVKKILLDRAKTRIAENNLKSTNKLFEMQMAKAAKKMIKNDNVDKQKYKRFVTNPKLRSKNLRKRHRRDINLNILKRGSNKNTKSRDLIADLAPAQKDFSIEEEALKSGEKYVDERVQFLKEPSGVDSALQEDLGQGYFENFRNYRIKRDNGIQGNGDANIPPPDVLGNIRRWQNRFALPSPNLRRRYNSEMVSTKRNKKMDSRLLKEKLENRKKMSDWIRDRKKKHVAPKAKRSVSNQESSYVPKTNEVKSLYVPKVIKDEWNFDNLKSIITKPSYSIEDLDEREFLQSLSIPTRKQRSTDTHLTENTIDDDVLNKIPKIKFYYTDNSITVATTTAETNDLNEINSNKTNGAILVGQEVETNDKTFFNGIVDTIRDFIESVYGKISSYFMG